MITDSYSKMLSDVGMRSMRGGIDDDYSEDIDVLWREQWKRVTEESAQELQRERQLERERELSALRSGSAPPTVEGSLSGYRGKLYSGGGDVYGVSEEELRSRSDPAYISYYYKNVNLNPRLPPPLLSREISPLARKEWGADGLIGLPEFSLGRQRKTMTEAIQDDVAEASESQFMHLSQNVVSTSTSRTYASALGASQSRSTTSDATDLVAGLSGLSLSVNNMPVGEGSHPKYQMDHETDNQRNFMNLLNEQSHVREHPPFSGYAVGGYGMNTSSPSILKNQQMGLNMPTSYDSFASGTSMSASGVDFQEMGGGFNLGPNFLASNLSRGGTQSMGSSVQNQPMDPLSIQSLRSREFAAFNDPTRNRAANGNAYMDLLELQKAYVSAFLASQRPQYGPACFSQNGGLDHQGYYGGIFPGSPLAGQALPSSPYGPSSPFRGGERNMRFTSGMGNIAWQSDPISNIEGSFASSLLDEFKMNKTRCFALSEIEGHIIEFSGDQYGSRFIQQKLETATVDEKHMVFVEIMPQALSLMTDVFGNYVVQKFLELGSAAQIRALADKLTGHVLDLSLQMYGCRVIQKAIEVVELDQKTTMVSELNGHIMRCVRDQNGNHVIQKCIECIPEDAIQFMITKFYDQVVTLSTHPYGCRVIQRVLEHCHSSETQTKVMSEILQSVIMLAQDQYGNYVVQHVLEHGRPDQRSVIIGMLMGHIIQMSQQKFASNVVEKCLTFGTPEERQLLVKEILGSADQNDPLQVLMKDQFANYVVQKVLETCDDHQLELILDRIKIHLNVLKKYTYGKHIVARVEKLVAAGERRIEFLSSYSASGEMA
ncbi:unnamed protein product [Cuscuta epithymum]|uniref:PUM-HD domain-containing protein n=1 Tax=Cuscuta epithymum TaxID=186058 RepID=A0AAV0EBK9_9ASTE|nr:unnamed protein product [Cuscuta epithymum]